MIAQPKKKKVKKLTITKVQDAVNKAIRERDGGQKMNECRMCGIKHDGEETRYFVVHEGKYEYICPSCFKKIGGMAKDEGCDICGETSHHFVLLDWQRLFLCKEHFSEVRALLESLKGGAL